MSNANTAGYPSLQNELVSLLKSSNPDKSMLKGLYIPTASKSFAQNAATLDSFKSIGEPPCVEGSSEGSLSDEERWQRAYEAVFCQNGMKKHGKKESRDLLSMVDAEKYEEECIDVLRLEKRDELERMKKESSAE